MRFMHTATAADFHIVMCILSETCNENIGQDFIGLKWKRKLTFLIKDDEVKSICTDQWSDK